MVLTIDIMDGHGLSNKVIPKHGIQEKAECGIAQ